VKTRNGTKNIGRKGDVDRYILYTVILLILLILIIALFFGGAYDMIKNLFFKEFLR
jgi:hypothetical protein